MPDPAVFLILSIALLIVGGGLLVTSVKAHWQAACPRCGYDLRGHAPRSNCPECGDAFTALPEGYIERRPLRFLSGAILLALGFFCFCGMIAAMIR